MCAESGPVTVEMVESVISRFILESLKDYGVWELKLQKVDSPVRRRYVKTLGEIKPVVRSAPEPFSDIEESILIALLDGPLKVEQIAAELGRDHSQLYGERGLKRLVAMGLIVGQGRGKGYALTGEGAVEAERLSVR